MLSKENIAPIEDILRDLEHPNPHINRVAFVNMKEYWPKESVAILIRNLDSKNVELRRKSVKGLGFFGKNIVKEIIKTYFSTKNKILKVSCLKVLIIIASNGSLDTFREEIKVLIESAIKDESAEVILTIVSFLRQNGEESLPYLKVLCRDKNVLKAKAAITAISEISEVSVDSFLKSIVNDLSLDKLVRESASQSLNFKFN